MKVVILAGGLGTRLTEETDLRPKPMIEIGGRPILWHIMKHYAHYGFKEFFIALGYRGEIVKRFFLDYRALSGSLTLDLSQGLVQNHETECEDWMVHLKDTGLDTATGSRIKRLQPWLNGESFMLTYGDGVSNIDLSQLLKFHKKQGRIATVTAVRPPARFGGLVFSGDLVAEFSDAGLLDEIILAVAPVLLGDGTRLFDHPGGTHVRLEPIDVAHVPLATSLRYRVVH